MKGLIKINHYLDYTCKCELSYPNEANFVLNGAILPNDCSSDVHDMVSVALQVLLHAVCGVDGLGESVPGER